jgi:hypothetical protein
MRGFVLLICVLCSAVCFAEVYKTVDKDGNVKYSDSPPDEQAQTVKLPELNTLPPDEQGQVYQSTAQPNNEFVEYQVEIISPRNEVVIPPGQRDLAVAVSINPGLQGDHLITYYIDGELVEETQSSNIVIQDPPRGGRTLTVEVIDQSGEVLGRAEPKTINVIRPIKKKN